jgi:hypothetical protein
METQDKGLRAAINDVSTMVREAASKSEAAALDAVDRAEAALARRRADWSRAKEVGGQVVQSLGHMGRTTVSGVAEFNGALGRYGKGALTDTIDIEQEHCVPGSWGGGGPLRRLHIASQPRIVRLH